MEVATPTVFLFSYFCGGRQSSNGASCSPLYSYFLIFVEVGNLQMEPATPAVFLFSYFRRGRQSSNGAI